MRGYRPQGSSVGFENNLIRTRQIGPWMLQVNTLYPCNVQLRPSHLTVRINSKLVLLHGFSLAVLLTTE